MAGPPAFLKKASKRRMDAALPTPNKPTNKSKVATFANPGNKAGQGLLQQTKSPPTGSASPQGKKDLPTSQENFLGQLMHARAGKPKTKVQPAAARKVAAMRLASKKGSNAASPF